LNLFLLFWPQHHSDRVFIGATPVLREGLSGSEGLAVGIQVGLEGACLSGDLEGNILDGLGR